MVGVTRSNILRVLAQSGKTTICVAHNIPGRYILRTHVHYCSTHLGVVPKLRHTLRRTCGNQFAAERAINGSSPAERVAIRRKEIAPLVDDLIEWMKRERARLSRHNDTNDRQTVAFTDHGLDCLRELIATRHPRGPERMLTLPFYSDPLHSISKIDVRGHKSTLAFSCG
jgi:hypothetical protein